MQDYGRGIGDSLFMSCSIRSHRCGVIMACVIKVSRLLGHRDSTITLKVYAQFIKDQSDHVQELASNVLL
jgi:hypothetical protein